MEINCVNSIKSINSSEVKKAEQQTVEHDNKYVGENVTDRTLALDPRARIAEAAIKIAKMKPNHYQAKLADILESYLKDVQERPMSKEEAQKAIHELFDKTVQVNEEFYAEKIKEHRQKIEENTSVENFKFVKSLIDKFAKDLEDKTDYEKNNAVYNIRAYVEDTKINKYNEDIAIKIFQNCDLKDRLQYWDIGREVITAIDTADKKDCFENIILAKPLRIYESGHYSGFDITKTDDGYKIDEYRKKYSCEKEPEYPAILRESLVGIIDSVNEYNKEFVDYLFKHKDRPQMSHGPNNNKNLDYYYDFLGTIQNNTSARKVRDYLKYPGDDNIRDLYKHFGLLKYN